MPKYPQLACTHPPNRHAQIPPACLHPPTHPSQANAIIQDIRRIVRNDTRVLNKLHRRVFLDRLAPTGDAQLYLSFYLEAANRDAFAAIKQVASPPLPIACDWLMASRPPMSVAKDALCLTFPLHALSGQRGEMLVPADHWPVLARRNLWLCCRTCGT
jgi:hypothetical protein